MIQGLSRLFTLIAAKIAKITGTTGNIPTISGTGELSDSGKSLSDIPQYDGSGNVHLTGDLYTDNGTVFSNDIEPLNSDDQISIGGDNGIVIEGDVAAQGNISAIGYGSFRNTYPTSNVGLSIYDLNTGNNASFSFDGSTISTNYPIAGAGVSGFSGASGFSGFSGITGGAGASGFSGLSGYSGSTGSVGTSGFSGASGFSGFSGSGLSGFSGYSGKSGFSGISGFSGYSGKSGFSGISGFSGFSGVGTSGFSGFSGSGISGFSGFSGISGFSGYSGKSGFSGISGYSGYSGKSGYSGVTPSLTGYAQVGIINTFTQPQTVTTSSDNTIGITIIDQSTNEGYIGFASDTFYFSEAIDSRSFYSTLSPTTLQLNDGGNAGQLCNISYSGGTLLINTTDPGATVWISADQVAFADGGGISNRFVWTTPITGFAGADPGSPTCGIWFDGDENQLMCNLPDGTVCVVNVTPI